MFSSIALIMLGIIFIYSASGPFSRFMNPPKPTWHFLMKQSLWAVVALTTMYIAYRIDYELLVKVSPFMMIAGILLLIAVFPLSSGNVKRWINIGGFTIQPSELFKIAAIIFMARVIAKLAGRRRVHIVYTVVNGVPDHPNRLRLIDIGLVPVGQRQPHRTKAQYRSFPVQLPKSPVLHRSFLSC